MPPSSMNDLFQFLTELLTTHSDTFQALGLNLFRGFALILIVWFGAKSALSSASGGPGFHFDHFAQLILTIAFGFAMMHYILIAAMIVILEAAVFFVIAFGYIAAAVAVLLGPIFIPFLIVPKMEWLFWGWFKAFLQYSFYPVVANAYLFVFGNILIHLVDSHPPPYDGPTIALLFAPLLFLLIAFVYGIVKIPSLVSSLFSGSSGESVIPKIL